MNNMDQYNSYPNWLGEKYTGREELQLEFDRVYSLYHKHVAEEGKHDFYDCSTCMMFFSFKKIYLEANKMMFLLNK
jgi:hypothetical protein